MAPREGSQEPSSTPDTLEKGMATINTLRYTKHLSPNGPGGIPNLGVADVLLDFRR